MKSKLLEAVSKLDTAVSRLVNSKMETKLAVEKYKRALDKEGDFDESKKAVVKTMTLEFDVKCHASEMKNERDLGKLKLEIAELKLIGKFESEKMRYLEVENQHLIAKSKKYDDVAAAHHKSLIQLNAFDKKAQSR